MTPFLRVLEHLVNVPFRLDEEARAGLAPLAGKVVRVSLSRPVLSFDMVFQKDRITISACAERSDVTIKGALAQFIALMRAKPEQTQKVMASGLSIEGDVDCAFAVKKLFERAALDWEEVLAQALGDAPAHLLSQMFQKTRNALRYGGLRLAHNAVTFAQEEASLLPRPWEVDAFLEAVDRLRDDADRLELRLRRLGVR